MLHEQQKSLSESINKGTQQNKKATTRKEIAYWSEMFDNSLKKARKAILKTINKIGQERKNAQDDQ